MYCCCDYYSYDNDYLWCYLPYCFCTKPNHAGGGGWIFVAMPKKAAQLVSMFKQPFPQTRLTSLSARRSHPLNPLRCFVRFEPLGLLTLGRWSSALDFFLACLLGLGPWCHVSVVPVVVGGRLGDRGSSGSGSGDAGGSRA